MRRWIALFLVAIVLMTIFAGCVNTTEDIANRDQSEAEAIGLEMHKIGVAVYNVKDNQIMMFKDYLDNYIKECFVDVTFIYSESITNEEEMMDFLEYCEENDVDGIMSFIAYDLKAELDFCKENKMYYVTPSSTFSQERFDSVADNPYYVGVTGPGSEIEYEETAKMTVALASKGDGKSFIILSGGATMNNEMHRLRTVAMLDNLQSIYGVTFEKSSEELAMVTERTDVEAGDLRVTICPGYFNVEQYRVSASEAIRSGEYTTILSSLPVTDLIDDLEATDNIECGLIDCFSEENYFGFKKGKVVYVVGKYQSEIGPAFAALYNAITGNAEAYRVNGKAFQLEQGFWTAKSETDYDAMYALASGAVVNAYNYSDLYSVIKSLTPDTTFEDFKKLTESYNYDACLARRSD